MTKGTVKRWLAGKGYGFIAPEDGDGDVFVHISDIVGGRSLTEGERVEFEVRTTYRGTRAVNVKPISE